MPAAIDQREAITAALETEGETETMKQLETSATRFGEKFVAMELTNPTTGLAIQIQTTDYHVVGWSPRYLVPDLASAIAKAPGDYEANVVQVNPIPAPSKQRLLVELRGHWPDYEPMSKDDFAPLV